MRSLRLPLLLAALVLAACEDPSNVGIGLVGETGGEPTFLTIEADDAGAADVVEVTGGSSRVLAGAVDDPAFGTISARAFVDVSAVSGMDSDFRSGQVTSAELRLVRSYVYGDTTAAVTVRLHDLTEELSPSGVRADTTLPLGPAIATYTFAPTDSLVVLELPASWVAANDTTLRSAAFGTVFHGFALAPAGETAVVGFDAAASRLRLVESSDTLSLPVTSTATTLERTGSIAVGADRVPLQDGVGPTMRFAFPFTEAEEALDAAVNRAVARIAADTTALDGLTPPGFYRPPVEALTLFGVTEDSLFVPLSSSVTRGDDGVFRFGTAELASVVQQMLLESSPIDHFELGVPNTLPTIDALVLYGIGTERAPEVELTVTPIAR